MSEPAADADPSFVLFDPADAPARLYTAPIAHRIARTDAEAAAMQGWAGEELARGREVALFAAFEAARALAGLPLAHAPVTPLVEGLSFAQATMLDGGGAVDAWLVRQLAALGGADAPAGLAGWRRGIIEAGYGAALARIAAYLAAGDTYQIDYTFPLHARAFGHPLALYRALRQRQPTAYRCLAYLGGDGATPGNLGGPSLHPSQSSRPVRASGRWVLSLSPELFFTLQPGGHIAARPMKGTAPRQTDPIQDAQAAAWLGADPKNRAENLMILDLLRNDLGRVAVPGSVQVPRRFTVEPYPRVWQMTSSVQAELAPQVGWPALWAALFPCGSVVGAPKHRSMQIIGELEPAARGLYTGAIGWLQPAPANANAARPGSPQAVRGVFSVAIRTLEIDDRLRRGTRAARLGLGSGVVADSDPKAEWAECLLKARFVTGLDPGLGLIETFAARWPEQRAHIAPHLARLVRSARYFGFRFDRRALLEQLARAHAALPATAAWPWSHRTRIELRHDGSYHLSTALLADLPRHEGRVQVLLADTLLDHAALDPDDLFLRHKTTHRARYDAAWKAAEARGAFDALFFNTRGELCEGGRSSVFVKLAGRWYTPPLRCGLLPGVARAALLTNATLGAAERIITRADLLAAEDLLLSNALRGALPAQLEVGPPSLPRPQHPRHLAPLARETNGRPA
ncbi:putative para-aminobenzoate synthase (Aminodeoxychorismate synthase) PabB [Thiomonas sp. X19]|uniref:chorismate-binding protein n=1 Tax=Thiomonas sp. X19 TaxID=1050370 RepID=UPI000B75D1AE|nr:chorismate-binding protein [Thiomonas sp. X19]SCC92771.1 putative para-aminobenzoate synthase (Aminodeoxychorismate synthase) PabB [Thiomonas sp. X19]